VQMTNDESVHQNFKSDATSLKKMRPDASTSSKYALQKFVVPNKHCI